MCTRVEAAVSCVVLRCAANVNLNLRCERQLELAPRCIAAVAGPGRAEEGEERAEPSPGSVNLPSGSASERTVEVGVVSLAAHSRSVRPLVTCTCRTS